MGDDWVVDWRYFSICKITIFFEIQGIYAMI